MKTPVDPRQRREMMGTQPVWSLLRRFSGPAIISMTVASTYNLVDAVFVGKLGTDALAAMAVTFPLVMSFTAIATGTGIGATSLITRTLGAGDRDKAERTAGVSITLCFILWAIIALTCLPYLDSLLRALGASETVLPLARSYMRILIYFLVFQYLGHILSNVIRSDGNPMFASGVAIGSSLLNIALDPLFIFGLGPVPAMGITGAATATVIAQGAGAGVFIWFIFSGRTAYRFRAACFLPDMGIIGNIYRTGVASIVRSGAQFIIMGVVNRTAASFGVIPLAVMGVLMRTMRFVLMPVLGLGQGMLPLIGYNYGAGNKARVAELVGKTMLAGLCWSVVCWIIIMLIPGQIIGAFNSEPDFLTEGVAALRIYALLLMLLGVQVIPSFFFQGIGKGLPATIITAARQVFFVLPAILVLPHFLGVNGIWASFPVADGLSFLLGITWMLVEFRRQNITFLWWKPREPAS